MDIMAGLSAAGQAYQIAKALRDVENAWNTVELKGQIIDLMDKLQEVRGALQDARDEMTAKDEEIKQLRKVHDVRASSVEHNGYLYRKNEEGKPIGLPYCRTCMEKSGLNILCTMSQVGRHAECPNCKAAYRDGYMM